MSNWSAAELIREGIRHCRAEGFRSALLAGLRLLNLNPLGYWYYFGYLLKRMSPKRDVVKDPFTVISVNPGAIERTAYDRVNRWRDLGVVRGGDWDQQCMDLNDAMKYRSVFSHFNQGVPWEKTDIYKSAISRIEGGESAWNGCQTKEDIKQRTVLVDRLYRTIRDGDFKSQEELEGRSYQSIVLDRHFDRSKEEVAVAIGRKGELLLVDGNHRLAIAHVLGLDEIPVHVVLRHTEWHQIREQFREEQTPSNKISTCAFHAEHPDIKPFVP